MARGGARPGAGRKKGIPNKTTNAQRAQIAASGLTPLEFLLAVMRGEPMVLIGENGETVKDDKGEAKLVFPRFDARLDAAKAAAPYVHPKLAQIAHTGEDGGPLQIELVRLTDKDIDDHENSDD
jgi:hypothetical protein